MAFMTMTEIFNVISTVISVTPMNRALQRIVDDKSLNFGKNIFSAGIYDVIRTDCVQMFWPERPYLRARSSGFSVPKVHSFGLERALLRG